MPTIDIPHGRLAYRVAGPEDSAAPPVVFLHGVLVDASLWTGVAERLAAQGIRSCALDLPLGSHTEPLREGADRTPRGVARMVLDALEALELTDVTLVGNDTGGALCQLVLDTDASRIGRLVLTNCDAFEQFPPPALRAFIALCRRPGRLAHSCGRRHGARCGTRCSPTAGWSRTRWTPPSAPRGRSRSAGIGASPRTRRP